MRQARKALKLNQTDFHDTYVVGTLRSFQRAEAGSNEAGVCLVGAFIRAGINANWLLTGEGPMLLKDLAPERVAVAEPLQVKINTKALGAAIDAMRKLAEPGETPESTAMKTAKFYQYLLDQGLITPTGIGEGVLKKAS